VLSVVCIDNVLYQDKVQNFTITAAKTEAQVTFEQHPSSKLTIAAVSNQAHSDSVVKVIFEN